MAHLAKIFPEISIKDIRFFYHGTYNVFEVKSKYIFRFPDRYFRNVKGSKILKRELEMLKIIREHVHFKIPNPIFISLDSDFPFMGYEKIKGFPLSQFFFNLDIEAKDKIAKAIGSILSELHSDDLVSRYPRKEYSANDYYKEWSLYYQKVQADLFHFLRPDQQRWVHSLFENFLSEKGYFRFQPKIVHGDFDISQILIDPSTHRITGVVDFEDSRIYDPAADLLFFQEGKHFLEKVIENYSYKIDIQFRNRMKFLYSRTFLPYIDFGYTANRSEMIHVGLKILDERMKKFPMKS